jgi:hypothetical protein
MAGEYTLSAAPVQPKKLFGKLNIRDITKESSQRHASAVAQVRIGPG